MEKLYEIFRTLESGYAMYNDKKIKIIVDKNEEIWFNAKDVVISLGYKNLKNTVRDLVGKNDKIQLRYINHSQNVKGIHRYIKLDIS